MNPINVQLKSRVNRTTTRLATVCGLVLFTVLFLSLAFSSVISNVYGTMAVYLLVLLCMTASSGIAGLVVHDLLHTNK